jgi:hypothetical protein
MRWQRAGPVTLAAFLLPGIIFGQERNPPRLDDEGLLKAQGIATDGPSLLAYLEKCSGNAEDLPKVSELVRKLSGPEKDGARKRLIALGPGAFPWLTDAQRGDDPTAAEQARRCVQEIEKRWDVLALPMVVRTLVRKETPDAGRAFLRFLPYAGRGELEEEVWYALDKVIRKKPDFQPAFIEALADPVPVRRAAAAYLLARWGNAEHQAKAKKLLDDPDPEVKLRVAQGLLGNRKKEAIPVLLGLLECRSLPLALQAEELLSWVGGESSPKLTISQGPKTTKDHKDKCLKAWHEWWVLHQRKLDLEKLLSGPSRPGLFFLQDDSPSTRIWLSGSNGKPRWELTGPRAFETCLLLPKGRFLVGVRGIGLTEYDLDWNVLWHYPEKRERHFPYLYRRLNGNTLVWINGYVELAPDGRKVRNIEVDRGFLLRRFLPLYPYQLTKDLWLYDSQFAGEKGALAVLKDDGKRGGPRLPKQPPAMVILHEFYPPVPLGSYVTFRLTPDGSGTILVVSPNDRKILLMDTKGKVVWQHNGALVPEAIGFGVANFFRNGNIRLTYHKKIGMGWGVVEMDPQGRKLSGRLPAGRPYFEVLRLGFDRTIGQSP